MSLSKTQIFLFFESGNYVKATRRLPQASTISVRIAGSIFVDFGFSSGVVFVFGYSGNELLSAFRRRTGIINQSQIAVLGKRQHRFLRLFFGNFFIDRRFFGRCAFIYIGECRCRKHAKTHCTRQQSVTRNALVISRFAEKDLSEPGVPRISPLGFLSFFLSTMIRLFDRTFSP